MSCQHRFDVGVYVLGALEPAEREAFEAHLPGCGDCARSLNEVAGLPGLLARAPTPVLPPTQAEPPDPDEPSRGGPAPGDAAPPDLLAATLRRVRRRRRTGRALAAAALVLALVAGGAAVWSGVRSGVVATPSAPQAVAREIVLPPVAGGETSGLAGLTARPWGTAISLSCRYDGEPLPAPPAYGPRTTYVLLVRGPDGSEQQIARWSPPPGQDVVVAAATDLPPDRVRELEVRTAEGETVMRS